MAHKSEKGTWSKTANIGCMWGLINMFNFRRFTSRRFLVSQNRRTGRRFGAWHSRRRVKLLTNCEGKPEQSATIDADGTKNDNLVTESVKNLINKEMSTSKQSHQNSKAESRQIIDESGECLDKSHSLSNKVFQVDRTRNTNELSFRINVGPYQSLFQDITERICNNFDIAVLETHMEGYKRNHHNVHQDSGKDIDAYLFVERRISDVLPCLDQINGEAFPGLSILQQILYETLETDLRDKFPDAIRTTPKDGHNTSEDLRHLLEMSVPYKELFLDAVVKVLQNPSNSLHCKSNAKHLENDIGNSKQEISFCYPNQRQEVQKNVMNELSCRQPSIANNKSQSSSRIVILKPNPKKNKTASNATEPSSQAYSSGLRLKEENGTVASHLFLHDVKRRLAHLLGDKCKDISQDAKTEESASSREGRRASCNIGKRSELEKQKAISPKIGCEDDSTENHSCINGADLGTISSSLCKEPDFSSAFRMTASGDGSANSEKKGSRSLRKLLSLPVDYSADIKYCSENHAMTPSSPQHMRSRSWNPEQDIDLKLASQPSGNAAGSLQIVDSIAVLSTTARADMSSEDVLPLEGLGKCGADESLILGINYAVVGDVATESENHSVTSLPDSFPSPPQDRLEEKSHHLFAPSTTMPDALLIHSPEVNESISDKQERPSPVSVLETSAIDAIGRPESTFTVNESYPKFKVVRRHIYFEDSDDSEGFLPKSSSQTHLSSCMEDEKFKYGYVKSLLEAAGLSSYPLSVKSQLSRQLLDPSLYDEVETPSEEIPDDLKLFFDCVADVVDEIYERSSNSKPWVSFAKPEFQIFPFGEKLIQEVLRELNGLYVLRSPKTFEEIVKRELETGPWMDIRAAVEDFGLEVEHAILDTLLEETVLELWD